MIMFNPVMMGQILGAVVAALVLGCLCYGMWRR